MKLFTKKEIIIFLTSTLSLAVIGIIITLAVMLPKRTMSARDNNSFLDLSKNPKPLTAKDFLIPEEYGSVFTDGFIYSREPKNNWDEAQIERYWIIPEDIGLDYYKKNNDGYMRDFFKNIP